MVTMSDVARVAKVSTTTVSHVINKSRKVNPETERAVREAVEAEIAAIRATNSGLSIPRAGAGSLMVPACKPSTL